MDAAELQRRAGEAAESLRRLGRAVSDKPVAAVLTAVAAGFLLGMVLRVLERPRRVEK